MDHNLRQSTSSHITVVRFISILTSYLCTGLPSDLCSSHFRNKILCAFLICLMHAMGLHVILLDVITLITLVFGKGTNQEASYYAVFLPLRPKHSPQHSVLKHNLCSSLSVREQISHPYKTRKLYSVYRTLIFVFLDRRQEDKRF
jgi:hypothetical protein